MKLNNKGRVTLIELISIIIIVGCCLYFMAASFGWLDTHMSNGNDGLYVNTCESVAKVNSLDGVICPVNDCGDTTGECIHHTSVGYVGYFDGVSNTIVGSKVAGYNSSKDPDVDGVTYTGEVNSMILRVTCHNGTITLDWVKGIE